MSNASEYIHAPLQKLEGVRTRMDTLQKFLSETVSSNTIISKQQMSMVTEEISTAIHQIILNGAALLAGSTTAIPRKAKRQKDPSKEDVAVKIKEEEGEGEEEEEEEEEGGGKEERSEMENVVELDAVELLAEHVHFCEVCGKGFKRDANLRMHMRAHGNQFKTPEALSKPDKPSLGSRNLATRFSCPYDGCNRNKKHKKFWPLKSVICVRNHFKRSHCPKMYSCDRCNKKSFSIVADLKSHLKHCGEARWKCSCGTSFSRKDKLFGHMALFEGHMPAVVGASTRDEEEEVMAAALELEEGKLQGNFSSGVDDEFFQGLLFDFDGFSSTVDGYTLQDVLNASPNTNNTMNNMSCGFWDTGFGII